MRFSIRQASIALFYLILFGVVVSGRDFVKLKFGPFYLLELTALICVGAIVWNIWARRGSNQFPWVLIPYFIFSGWGLFRLGWDLMEHQLPNSEVSLTRAMQLALLIVYPALWSAIGFYLVQYSKQFLIGIPVVLFISQLAPNLTYENGVNIGLGPLWIVGLWALILGRKNLSNRGEFSSHWVLVLASIFGLLSFLALFKGYIQRTTLVQSVVMIVLFLIGAMAVRSQSLRIKYLRGTGLTAVALIVALGTGGLFRSTGLFEELNRIVSLDRFRDRTDSDNYFFKFSRAELFKSFLKGEDLENGEFRGWTNFAKSRKYFWAQGLEEWKSAPYFGVGFASEVPKMIWENMPNRTNFDSAGSAPVNGVHNSYLTVAARLGTVGLLFLLVLITAPFISIWRMIKSESDSINLWMWISAGGFAGLVVYSAFNVGLESPHYASLVWLLAGTILSSGWSPQQVIVKPIATSVGTGVWGDKLPELPGSKAPV